jgi:hypothetical protein
MATLAILPASYVWAAAQFAVKVQDGRDALMDVCLRVEGAELTGETIAYLYSTNGHFAFRARVKIDEQPLSFNRFPVPTGSAVEEFKFNAAAFGSPGKLLQGGGVVFDSDGTAKLQGSKASDLREWRTGYSGSFPNIGQLWPDEYQLTCNPGLRVGASASYLATIAKVASKLAKTDTVDLRTANSPNSPMVWSFESDWGVVEVLLMPKQLATVDAKAEADRKQEKERALASDLKELAAYRAGGVAVAAGGCDA